MRKTILYIAASLDGYIAGPDDDLSFLAMAETEGEDYGYANFLSSVDTVIMGRKTFDWVMTQVPEFPHAGLESYIITRTVRPDTGNIKFHTGDLKTLVDNLKNKEGKNIFIDGGAEIVNELLKHSLIDELIIFVIPILLGDGVRLFHNGIPEQKLELTEAKSYLKGVVKLHYKLA
jgi:dihydrofolate reductase